MIRRTICFLSCFFIALILLSCDLSKPEEVNKAELEQILNQMETDFRQLDVPGIMSAYHTDFFHNGEGILAEQTRWLNRIGQYSSFEFTNLEYDIDDDRAIVSGTVKWHASGQTYITNEPEDNGDFSYFIKENGVWQIYGNQHLSRITE